VIENGSLPEDRNQQSCTGKDGGGNGQEQQSEREGIHNLQFIANKAVIVRDNFIY
jgi:hypothetical protein